jgi:hypothetical protein
MNSGPSDSTRHSASDSVLSNQQTDRTTDWSSKISVSYTFQLIDRLLPFEACLYHQVLPISVQGSRINLGMVNPADQEALTYVRQILSYLSCSLVPRKISSQAHNAALSAYLKYVGERRTTSGAHLQLPASQPPQPSTSGLHNFQTLILEGEPDENLATIIRDSSAISDLSIASDLDALLNLDRSITPATSAQSAAFLHQSAGLLNREPLAKPLPPPQSINSTNAAVSVPSSASAQNAVPTPLNLQIHAVHSSSPMKVLAVLPPYNLVQELLARVLSGGIGRLIFERQRLYGRIIWSQNGIIKAELEDLPPETLQGAIDELKRLHNLPLAPIQEPVRAEIERFYEQNRLLLRLQVINGVDGEEATLQVLRGAALKFYQQQQLSNLSQEALTVSEQLLQKLHDIHERVTANSVPDSVQWSMLSTLNELLSTMNQQISHLDTLH